MDIIAIGYRTKDIVYSVLQSLELKTINEISGIKLGNLMLFKFVIDADDQHIQKRKIIMSELNKYGALITPCIEYYNWDRIIVIPKIRI